MLGVTRRNQESAGHIRQLIDANYDVLRCISISFDRVFLRVQQFRNEKVATCGCVAIIMCSGASSDHNFIENLLSVEQARKFFDASICHTTGEYHDAAERIRMAVRCARTLYLADAVDDYRRIGNDDLAGSLPQRTTSSIRRDWHLWEASQAKPAIISETCAPDFHVQNVTTRSFVSSWFSRCDERQLSYYNHTSAQYQYNEIKEDVRSPALRTIFNEALERNGFEMDALLCIYEQSSRGCPEHKKVDTIRLQLERDEDSLKPICGAELKRQQQDSVSPSGQQLLAYEGGRKKWKPCLQPD